LGYKILLFFVFYISAISGISLYQFDKVILCDALKKVKSAKRRTDGSIIEVDSLPEITQLKSMCEDPDTPITEMMPILTKIHEIYL